MKNYGIVQPPSTDICCNHSLLPSFICNEIRILRFTYQAIFLIVMNLKFYVNKTYHINNVSKNDSVFKNFGL